MRITYIHQYFKTPEEGGAIRSYHIAKAMVDAGHDVNLITTHNKAEQLTKQLKGINIHYLPISYSNSMGFVARVWSFILFAYRSYHIAKDIPTDLVYATSTPLSVGWTALKLKQKRQVPYVFEVRDLWPEAPKQLGAIKNNWLLKKLEAFEKKIYLHAEKIIALSPAMKTHIDQHTETNKTEVITNFADNELADTLNDTTKNNKLTITYTGALGYANDIDFLTWMITELDERFDHAVSFIILGEGKFEKEIKEACSRSKNSTFYGFESKKRSYERLKSSDIALTTFLDFPILETNSPNKFFDGLATSNITLINFNGWIEDIITQSQCGYSINKSSLSNTITDLLNNPSKVVAMKENAKKLALKAFDKTTLCDKLLTIITS